MPVMTHLNQNHNLLLNLHKILRNKYDQVMTNCTVMVHYTSKQYVAILPDLYGETVDIS